MQKSASVTALASLVTLPAADCGACHGEQDLDGIFYTYPLTEGNADKLTIKTNKYRPGKTFHPLMKLSVGLIDMDVAAIPADDPSPGKPAFTPPFVKIVGDDDEWPLPGRRPSWSRPTEDGPRAVPCKRWS